MSEILPSWDETTPVEQTSAGLPTWNQTAPVGQGRGMSKVKNALYNIGKGLPAAGALAGGMASLAAAPETFGASLAGGSLMAGAGAALGKGAQNIINAAIGSGETPQTALEAGSRMAKEGAETAGMTLIGGKLVEGTLGAIKKIVPQAIKAMSGVSEKTAARVIKDPEILTNALPMHDAEEQFGNFIDNSGYKYGPEAMEQVLGKAKWSEAEADGIANDVLANIKDLKNVSPTDKNAGVLKANVQAALAARQSLANAATRETTSGNRDMARYLLNKVDKLDDWIEPNVPGYADAREMYSNAKAADAFSSWLPVNKNGTPSVLRSGVMAGLLMKGHPVEAALMSPKVLGAGLRGYSAVAPSIESATPAIKAIGPGVSGAVTEAINPNPKAPYDPGLTNGLTPEKMAQYADIEMRDHPQLDRAQAEMIVRQEYKDDPHFYDSETTTRTPHDVKADYKSGRISKEDALKELREKHGFK